MAAVVYFLGFTPAPGQIVLVPASVIAQHSRAEQIAAQLCARQLKIRWRIKKDK
jgi:hypothetical protein